MSDSPEGVELDAVPSFQMDFQLGLVQRLVIVGEALAIYREEILLTRTYYH